MFRDELDGLPATVRESLESELEAACQDIRLGREANTLDAWQSHEICVRIDSILSLAREIKDALAKQEADDD